LFDDHLCVSHYIPSPEHTQVTPVESHSYSSDEDQPLELDTASDDEEPDDDMPAISVEEGNLDTTTSMPNSEYFDEYEFNQQHLDSIHKKSNVTEKMSKDISDKVTAAESLSSMSSTRSGQVYSESVRKAKVSYDDFKWSGHRSAHVFADGSSTASHKSRRTLLEAPTGTLLFYYKDIKQEIVHLILLEEHGVLKKWVIIMNRRQDSDAISRPAGKSGPLSQD